MPFRGNLRPMYTSAGFRINTMSRSKRALRRATLAIALACCGLFGTSVFAQAVRDSVGLNRRALDLSEALHEAKLAEIEARISYAQARRSLIDHQFEQERKVEDAELTAESARQKRERYLQAESEKRRLALRDENQLAINRHEQVAERLKWSERLANEGLISQAQLELDKALAKGMESELRAADRRLRVFESCINPRLKIETESAVAAAEGRVEALKQLGAAAEIELQAEASLAKQAWGEAQRRAESLAAIATDKARSDRSRPKVSRAVWRAQTRVVEMARASLQRIEAETAVRKKSGDGTLMRRRRMVTAAELELDEFLKSTKPDRRRALLTTIRTISESLSKAEQQLDWSERVIRKGYITRSQLKTDELAVLQQQAKLRNAQRELAVLDAHTLRREEGMRRANLAVAKRELARRNPWIAALAREFSIIVEARRTALELHRFRSAELAKRLPGGESEQLADAVGGG